MRLIRRKLFKEGGESLFRTEKKGKFPRPRVSIRGNAFFFSEPTL